MYHICMYGELSTANEVWYTQYTAWSKCVLFSACITHVTLDVDDWLISVMFYIHSYKPFTKI